MSDNTICSHLKAVTHVKTSKDHVCEECVKNNGRWLHLRVCQTCGATLCCDDSPQKHMTQHHHATSHPVISSAEAGERWMYCYPDDQVVEY